MNAFRFCVFYMDLFYKLHEILTFFSCCPQEKEKKRKIFLQYARENNKKREKLTEWRISALFYGDSAYSVEA